MTEVRSRRVGDDRLYLGDGQHLCLVWRACHVDDLASLRDDERQQRLADGYCRTGNEHLHRATLLIADANDRHAVPAGG